MKPWIRRVLDVVIAEPSLSLINVNLPREPRGLLWTRVSVRQYRRPHCSDQGPAGAGSLLVYREAARARGRRHRSLGRGAELDLADAIADRSDRRGAAQRRRSAAAARSRCSLSQPRPRSRRPKRRRRYVPRKQPRRWNRSVDAAALRQESIITARTRARCSPAGSARRNSRTRASAAECAARGHHCRQRLDSPSSRTHRC